MSRFQISAPYMYRINIINPYSFIDEMTQFVERDIINHVINLSMREDETLKKDENVELDCSKETCKTKGLECMICLETIKTNSNIFKCKGCQDTFHYSCMNKWIKMKSDCPKCRQPIPVRNIDNDGFEEWINNQLKL